MIWQFKGYKESKKIVDDSWALLMARMNTVSCFKYVDDENDES